MVDPLTAKGGAARSNPPRPAAQASTGPRTARIDVELLRPLLLTDVEVPSQEEALFIPSGRQELPPDVRALVDRWIAVYEEMNLTALAAIIHDLYDPWGTAFEDPLQCAIGRGAVYRQFAALKKLTSRIQVEPYSVSAQLLPGLTLPGPRGDRRVLRLRIHAVQRYNIPIPSLMAWPILLLKALLGTPYLVGSGEDGSSDSTDTAEKAAAISEAPGLHGPQDPDSPVKPAPQPTASESADPTNHSGRTSSSSSSSYSMQVPLHATTTLLVAEPLPQPPTTAVGPPPATSAARVTAGPPSPFAGVSGGAPPVPPYAAAAAATPAVAIPYGGFPAPSSTVSSRTSSPESSPSRSLSASPSTSLLMFGQHLPPPPLSPPSAAMAAAPSRTMYGGGNAGGNGGVPGVSTWAHGTGGAAVGVPRGGATPAAPSGVGAAATTTTAAAAAAAAAAATAAPRGGDVGLIVYHYDTWHNLPVLWRPLRKVSTAALDIALQILGF